MFFGFRLNQTITETCQNEQLVSELPVSSVSTIPGSSSVSSPHQSISNKQLRYVKETIVEEIDKNVTINETVRAASSREKLSHPSEDRTMTITATTRPSIPMKKPRIVDVESEPNLNQRPRIDSRRN